MDSVMMHAFPSFPEVPDLKKEVGFLKTDLDFKINVHMLRTETLELKYEKIASDLKAIEEVVEDCFCKCDKRITKETFTAATTSIYEEIATLAKYQRDTRTKYLMFEGKLAQQEKRHAQDIQRLEAKMMEQEKRHAIEMERLYNKRLNVSSEDESLSSENSMTMPDRRAKFKRVKNEPLTKLGRFTDEMYPSRFVSNERIEISDSGDFVGIISSEDESVSSENSMTKMPDWRAKFNERIEISDSGDFVGIISESEDEDDDLTKEILKRRQAKYFKLWKEMPTSLPIAPTLSDMLYEENYPSL